MAVERPIGRYRGVMQEQHEGTQATGLEANGDTTLASNLAT